MATQIILLERVENLGNMGDVVAVRPGYARNFLLPQKKALRANKENIAYFEAKKKFLQAENDKRKAEAEKLAKKLDGLKAPIVRQASEAGQLYGSVTSRDIAVQVAEQSGLSITREMIYLNQSLKTLGLFPVDVYLHPEVKVTVTMNIARSLEEAETQAKTGKVLTSAAAEEEVSEDALNDVLEADALEAKKEQDAREQAETQEEEAAAQAKSKARAAKKAVKKPKESEEDAASEEVEIG